MVVFTETDIRRAVEHGAMGAESAASFIAFLNTAPPSAAATGPENNPVTAPASRFDFLHMLWYAGALLVLGAMGVFSTLAFSRMGGQGLAITGLVYAVVMGIAGHHLWNKPAYRTPGGLLIACSIGMIPMIVFGVQEATGWWAGMKPTNTFRDFYHYVKGGFIPMEIATILACFLALRRYPFAFIAFPAAVCLLFLSMDLADWIARPKAYDSAWRQNVSLYFGLTLGLATFWLEQKKRSVDYAFWLHLVAALTFWVGLSLRHSDSELAKALYCAINIGLLGWSVFMRRRVYAVFGVIGVMVYLGHLANKVFKDQLLFPFALSAIGLALIGLGLLFAKNRTRIDQWVNERMPNSLQRLRPPLA